MNAYTPCSPRRRRAEAHPAPQTSTSISLELRSRTRSAAAAPAPWLPAAQLEVAEKILTGQEGPRAVTPDVGVLQFFACIRRRVTDVLSDLSGLINDAKDHHRPRTHVRDCGTGACTRESLEEDDEVVHAAQLPARAGSLSLSIAAAELAPLRASSSLLVVILLINGMHN